MAISAPLTSARWQRLLPIAFITYTFAYLDRSNYSIGAAGGLKHDLHIDAGAAALLGGLFFLGYFFFQVPMAHYAARRSVRRLIFWTLLGWGVFAAAQGVIPWLWLLLIDRFLLGVAEAAVIPAMLILLMHWFTSRERGRANSILILGNPVTVLWMSAVSGYLIQATSWRWMFIAEGLPAIAWAFVFRALVADYPAQASWLPREEAKELERQLESEQSGLPAVHRYAEAFRLPAVIILALQYLLWSVGVYGFVFWLPTIIKAASHQGIGNTGALSAAPYALAVVMMLVVSFRSDRRGERRHHVWPYLLAGAVFFYLSYQLHGVNFWLSWGLLIATGGCIYAPYGPYFAFIAELLPASVSGAAIALVNSAGALGGFVGAYLVGWLVGSGSEGAAFLFMAGCMLAASILMLPVRRPQTATSRMRVTTS